MLRKLPLTLCKLLQNTPLTLCKLLPDTGAVKTPQEKQTSEQNPSRTHTPTESTCRLQGSSPGDTSVQRLTCLSLTDTILSTSSFEKETVAVAHVETAWAWSMAERAAPLMADRRPESKEEPRKEIQPFGHTPGACLFLARAPHGPVTF